MTENAELQQQLTMTEETVRREQQQIRQLVHVHVDVRELPFPQLDHAHVVVYVLVCIIVGVDLGNWKGRLLATTERTKAMPSFCGATTTYLTDFFIHLRPGTLYARDQNEHM